MYKTQLARKLRAEDQRNAALKNNDVFHDDDLEIKVRKLDENSNLVPRFSQGNTNKVKVNDGATDTVDYIEAFVKKNNIKTCGVWSVFGEPYNPQGAPDVELLRHAQKCKEERRKRRKTKKKTGADETEKSKTTFSTTMTWGGNRNKSKKMKKSSVYLDPKMPETSKLQRDDFAIDPVLYQFCSQYIVDSEKRVTLAKNECPFGQQIATQKQEYGKLFEILNIKKNSNNEKKERCTEKRGGRSAANQKSNRKSGVEKEIFQDKETKKQPFIIYGNEINRWRNEFLNERNIQQHRLKKQLADNKLKRIEVYQSKEYLANIAALIGHDSKNSKTSPSESIWDQAKNLSHLFDFDHHYIQDHEEKAKALYHDLLLFIEYNFNPTSEFSTDVVDLICYIKSLLENGLPANSNIFFECFRYSGQNVLQCADQMKIFCFLRKYFNIKEDIVKNFMFQMGWHISSSKMNNLMTDSDSFFVQ